MDCKDLRKKAIKSWKISESIQAKMIPIDSSLIPFCIKNNHTILIESITNHTKRALYELVKYHKCIDVVRLSSNYGYIDSIGNSPLSVAIYSYNYEAFDHLVTVMDIDHKNHRGITPIHMAILVHNIHAINV